MPKVLAEIGGMELIAYVFVASMFTSCIVAPIAANLSSIFGRRRVLLLAVIWLLFTIILAALAQNVYQLIFVLGLQGIGGAFAITLTMITISDVCTKEERAKWIGLYGSLLGFLGIISPFLGGFIVDNFNWRWIFLVMVPVGLIGFLLIWRFMPTVPKFSEAKVDVLGSVIFAITVSAFLLITILSKKLSWGSTIMVVLYLVIIVGLILFILAEKRAVTPIMPMSLFSIPIFRLLFIAVIFSGIASVPLGYYLPMYLQKIKGLTATESGLYLMGRGVIVLFVSAFNGWMISRIKEFRWNALMLVVLIGIAVLSAAMMDAQTSTMIIVLTVIIWGLGGASTSVFHIGAQMSIPPLQMAAALGAVNFFISFSAALSQMISGIFIRNPVLIKGLQGVFLVAFVGALITIVAVIAMLTQGRKIYTHRDSGIPHSH